MKGVLVIVPCGQKKIWDRNPSSGTTAAKHAYIGPPFGINRAFAERFGEVWIILSAKYGFIEPDFEIASPYNITFKKKRTGPITAEHLREQVDGDNLAPFTTVIGLGGKVYREAIELAFDGMAQTCDSRFPACRLGRQCRPRREQLPQTIRCGKGRPVNERRSRCTASQRHLQFGSRAFRWNGCEQIPV